MRFHVTDCPKMYASWPATQPPSAANLLQPVYSCCSVPLHLCAPFPGQLQVLLSTFQWYFHQCWNVRKTCICSLNLALLVWMRHGSLLVLWTICINLLIFSLVLKQVALAALGFLATARVKEQSKFLNREQNSSSLHWPMTRECQNGPLNLRFKEICTIPHCALF